MVCVFLQVGSISWLYYSDRIAELPLGVFGVAIATVILPNLSRKMPSMIMSSILEMVGACAVYCWLVAFVAPV